MKITTILNLNAVVIIALGIAFALYSPLVMAFLAVPELAIDTATYWHVTAFARMFGAALFGWGFLVWSAARAEAQLAGTAMNSILRSLFIGHLVLIFAALTQQSSVWLTPVGWAINAVFIVFAALYLYLIIAPQPQPRTH